MRRSRASDCAVCICATGTRKPTAWYALFSMTMRMLMAGLLPWLAGAVDVPTAAHEHMSSEDAAAGEMDQQPLAARLDAVDVLAGEGVSSWKRVRSG